jgi:hypothetical protein
MPKRVRRFFQVWLLASIYVSMSACSSGPVVQPLPARDAAFLAATPNNPRMPKLLLEGSAKQSVYDELAPYEQVRSQRFDSASYVLKFRLQQLIGNMPDAVTYAEGSEEIVGVVSQSVGFGVSTGHAVKAVPYRVVAYREIGGVLPISYMLSTGTVMAVTDANAAGGIKEGDIIVRVAGFDAIAPSRQEWIGSMMHVSRIGWRAGDLVDAEWIRPGTGAMRGQLRLLANPRSYRSEQDWTLLNLGRVLLSERASGRPGWYFSDR